MIGPTGESRKTGKVLGVDLGSSKIAVSLWSPEGRRLDWRRFDTLAGGPAPNLAEIVRRSQELTKGAAVAAVGISAGGPIDPERGLLISVPNQAGWEGCPISSELERALGAPAGLENDANAGAMAEHRFGAGRGASDMAFVTFSTGIGAGLILGGRLYRGHRHLAGEVGHQILAAGGEPCGCGGKGCLEAYASGAAIRRQLELLRQRDAGLPRDARELVQRAREGDAFSVEFLGQVARRLAHGLANLIFILNPQRIILGTIAVHARELILDPLRREIELLVWPSLREGLEIRAAELGETLGDHAAFCAAPLAGPAR
jgi:glucokinase